MKIIQQTTTDLIVKDSAGCLWLVGLFFVAVAGTFVVGLMGAFNNLNELNQLEQAAAWIISLAGIAAGIWMIYSNPSITSDFDKREGVIKIRRKGLMRNEKEIFPLTEIKDVVINESRDDDNDPIYSVDIILKSSKTIALTKTWLYKKEELQKSINEIKKFLTDIEQ